MEPLTHAPIRVLGAWVLGAGCWVLLDTPRRSLHPNAPKMRLGARLAGARCASRAGESACVRQATVPSPVYLPAAAALLVIADCADCADCVEVTTASRRASAVRPR